MHTGVGHEKKMYKYIILFIFTSIIFFLTHFLASRIALGGGSVYIYFFYYNTKTISVGQRKNDAI